MGTTRALRTLGLAALALALAGCGGTKTVTKTVRVAEPPPPGHDVVLFGHAKSLKGTAGHYRLVFDPALWLSGTAAEELALETTGSRDVPNDHITLDEGDTTLTFLVRDDARVTLVGRAVKPIRVTVAELADIAAGRNLQHRPLFGKWNDFAYWIRIGDKYPNPVVALDQQYSP